MDSYTHDSFTVLRATELIREAVDHILSQRGLEASEELKRDLRKWHDTERVAEKNGDGGVEEVKGGQIAFDLVRRIHQQLQKTPLGVPTSHD